MKFPAALIAYLRSQNSGHIIGAVNEQQNLMIDGQILPSTLYLTAAFGGTGSYTPDQIEGYFLLSSAQQTTMNAYFNTLISSYLATSMTNAEFLSITNGQQFSDVAIGVVPSPQFKDDTYTGRTAIASSGLYIELAPGLNALANQQGGGTTAIVDNQVEVQSAAAFNAGTLTAAVVIAGVQQPQ
jgi:hypothetical protein